jgi:ABC-type transport system substrate-binding protein
MVRREFPEERAIAAYLKGQWASVGVDVSYVITDEEELARVVYYYSYDMMMWYWSSDVDPNYMLFCQSSHAWSGWSDNMYYNESYEENYSRSVSEMNPSQRKAYVDNCQRIHYRDAAYIILAYNYQTYAWRTDTFSGWGDWSADPGRSIDNFWTGNPLWFDLEPVRPASNMTLYLGIVGVVAAAAVAVVVVMRLRKRPVKPT